MYVIIFFNLLILIKVGLLGGSVVKNLTLMEEMQEMQFPSLAQEEPLE